MDFEIEWNGSEWEVWADAVDHDVFFCPEGADEDEPPTDAQQALIAWFVANADEVLAAAIRAGSERRSGSELELVAVNIQPIVHGDRPYVGVELEDPEDDEHGLGVLLHGTRVVRTGGGGG